MMKKYLIGAIIGFMLSLGVGAHAEVVSMIGKVIDGSFPIKIKGVTLNNPAITIEGVSYVPTREFAESLGATVKFDANLGIEVVPPAATSSGENPLMKPYRELNDKIGKLVEEKQSLEMKINDIKTHHETMNQNTDDLQQQVSDKQAQIDKLVEEKQALETQMQSQQ